MPFTNRNAREIFGEYGRTLTGRLAGIELWRSCVQRVNLKFGFAVAKPYLIKHFKENAKGAMVEMVADIKNEFKQILDQVTV